jgi:hypothetical protein
MPIDWRLLNLTQPMTFRCRRLKGAKNCSAAVNLNEEARFWDGGREHFKGQQTDKVAKGGKWRKELREGKRAAALGTKGNKVGCCCC